MNKWNALITLSIIVLLFGYFFKNWLHHHYFLIVIFFVIQTIVFFRIEQWLSKKENFLISLIKITLRMLTSFIFITVLVYGGKDVFSLVTEFIIIYLVYMVFEIVCVLTNLHKN